MKHCFSKVLALGAVSALVGLTRVARADEVVVNRERTTVTGPNRDLLRSGVWTLGLSYVPALVVGISSSQSADKSLYVPVAGPWLDYATRDCRSCSHETFNKALLITDGVFQGIGALQILGSFLFLETRTSIAQRERKLAKAPAFQVSPSRLGGSGYGLTAVGSF
ncbi:MAG: hypothetical protein QM756_07195 [Polyangiaceae bacterium]